MKVSILVPVYNVGKYIERCAISLFEQTYDDLEYVFVDDCTPDNSFYILEEVLKKYPNRRKQVKIVHHENNSGVAVARNTALDNATGYFIVWVDPDDYVEKCLVEQMVTEASNKNADVVVIGFRLFNNYKEWLQLPPQLETPHDYCEMMLLRKVDIGVCGKMALSSLYEKHALRCPVGVISGEDAYLSIRLCYYAQKIVYVQRALYHYDCTRSDSITSYIKGFSEEKNRQLWNVWNLLYRFFINKEQRFLKALQVWEFKLALGTIIECTRENASRQIVECMYKHHIDCLPITLQNHVSFLKRIPLYIRNYKILHYYFKFMAWMKHDVLKKNKRG